METDFYKAYMEWFESLALYQEYVSKFPEPFCNPAFASALALAAILFLLVSTWEHFRNWRIRKRIKRKNRELELKHMEMQMKEEEQRKRVAEVEEYMRFMMLAQMQNVTSLMGLSFEQWRYHRFGVDNSVREVVGCQTIETEAETAGADGADVLEKTKETEQVSECEASADEILEKVAMEEPEDELSKDAIFKEEAVLQKVTEDISDESIFVEDEDELPELPVSLIETEEDSDVEKDEVSAILTHCELPKETNEVELTEAQQSDFAKLISMMQAQEKQKEEIGAYNRQRTEITKNNMEVLDRGLQAASKSEDKKKHGGKNADSLNKRKQAALEALEADKQKEAGKASGEKRKLFSGCK